MAATILKAAWMPDGASTNLRRRGRSPEIGEAAAVEHSETPRMAKGHADRCQARGLSDPTSHGSIVSATIGAQKYKAAVVTTGLGIRLATPKVSLAAWELWAFKSFEPAKSWVKRRVADATFCVNRYSIDIVMPPPYPLNSKTVYLRPRRTSVVGIVEVHTIHLALQACLFPGRDAKPLDTWNLHGRDHKIRQSFWVAVKGCLQMDRELRDVAAPPAPDNERAKPLPLGQEYCHSNATLDARDRGELLPSAFHLSASDCTRGRRRSRPAKTMHENSGSLAYE